jgi:hypothetical protein
MTTIFSQNDILGQTILSNVCSVKKDTERSSVLLPDLVSFFMEQTLRTVVIL